MTHSSDTVLCLIILSNRKSVYLYTPPVIILETLAPEDTNASMHHCNLLMFQSLYDEWVGGWVGG